MPLNMLLLLLMMMIHPLLFSTRKCHFSSLRINQLFSLSPSLDDNLYSYVDMCICMCARARVSMCVCVRYDRACVFSFVFLVVNLFFYHFVGMISDD